MGALVIGAVILWIVPVFVARSIGHAKNREGLAYGLFLGWLGVIIVALLPPAAPVAENGRPVPYRDCPHCKERMRSDASVCPHCRLPSDKTVLKDGVWWMSRDGEWYFWSGTQWQRATAAVGAAPRG